ncbi:MAG: Sec-independent protein translocase protein TatB [Betaproteobacteria bacterium]|nr:Sec-independent protein translocase protein TatB [Betaproteobacteria bacterium]
MFDISFSEILVIAVVAMVVIGPKRLPKTVRTLGLLMGRAQRYVGEVKADIQRELELEELKKLRQSAQDISQDIKQSIRAAVDETEKAVKQAEGSVREAGAELSRVASGEPEAQVPKAEAKKALTETPADVASADTVPAIVVPAAVATTEPQAEVPAFLQGEVALSIPEAPPTVPQKSEA